MMIRIVLLGLALCPVFVTAQTQKFTLRGKIGNLNTPAKVYLTYSDSGRLVQDSSAIKNGIFQFKNNLSEPAYAQLTLDHDGKHTNINVDSKSFYLEGGTINIIGKDSIRNATISGSQINADNKKFAKFIEPATKKIDAINAVYYQATDEQKKDTAFKKDWQAKLASAREELRNLQKQFIQQNPDSYISLLTLVRIAGRQINVAEIRPMYNSLSSDIQNTPAAKRFEEAMAKSINTAIGAMAPVFTQNDVNGKPVSLADFRGKYVLLDFWASWCVPCRVENPNVVKNYNKYKHKNFTVLGVSLDRPGAKDAWLAAIKADGLPWTQVSDLKFWDNEAALLYGLQAIPQNFLIDPSGKIIAKDLHGVELDKMLASIFND
jgi:peroxiredoxin